MNPTFNAEPQLQVRWNALENTLLSYIYFDERNGYATEGKYDYKGLCGVESDICDVLNPEKDESIPDRFYVEDHTGTVPLEQLLDTVRAAIANLDSYGLHCDDYEFDPEIRP